MCDTWFVIEQVPVADGCGDMPLIDQLKDNASKWKADFQQLDKEGKLVKKLATMHKPVVVRIYCRLQSDKATASG